jgi:crossover junction endodeoxyribonuclease RuvC
VRVLGIDPGTRITGYGCVEASRAARGPGAALIEAGVFRLDTKRPVADRLLELDTDLRELIDRLRPDVVAVEMIFSHVKHPATAMVMAHARGVILLGAKRAGLPLVELRPSEVKKSLTGFGHAEKAQIQRAVQECFALPEPPKPPDVADALAIALCALRRG